MYLVKCLLLSTNMLFCNMLTMLAMVVLVVSFYLVYLKNSNVQHGSM